MCPQLKGQILLNVGFYLVFWTLLIALFFPMINNLHQDTLARSTNVVSDFFTSTTPKFIQKYVQSVRLSTDQHPQFLQGYPLMIFIGISLSGYLVCEYQFSELLSFSNFVLLL